MIHADTDGLLDKCHCGAVAGFEHWFAVATLQEFDRACCTDCAETTLWCKDKMSSVIEWNNLIRGIKKREKK